MRAYSNEELPEASKEELVELVVGLREQIKPVYKAVEEAGLRTFNKSACEIAVECIRNPFTPPIDYAFLEGMTQRVTQTVIYGDTDDPPILFNRFVMVKYVA